MSPEDVFGPQFLYLSNIRGITMVLPMVSCWNTCFLRNLLFTKRTCPPTLLLPSGKTFRMEEAGGILVRAHVKATSPPKNVKGKIGHAITFQDPRIVFIGVANGF